ncbi:DUF3265 domain-containing protein [Vibrio vulnificus]|nr:DUF3265 domain-containing protein [Vibrio vulnificus]
MRDETKLRVIIIKVTVKNHASQVSSKFGKSPKKKLYIHTSNFGRILLWIGWGVKLVNKALKRDSCRVAFLVCGEFCVESGLRKVFCGTHPLTRR